MSRLIIISNRVSVPKARSADPAQGGLAVALAAALRETRGIWFGWSGSSTEHFTGSIEMHREEGVTTATVDLEDQDVDEYYNGYANRTLWPLFHYRIDLAEFDRNFGAGYERVNDRFAATVSPLIEPDDIIWVHDYHLIPLGQRLRQNGHRNRLGFFLHIPWPPHRLLTALPFHRRLVESMLDYDLIGFQTQDAMESFHHYLERELGASIDGEGRVAVAGKSFRTGVFPIGIDAKSFEELRDLPDAREAYRTIRDSAGDKKMIIGVDRLDYSKGLVERFNGYGQFLEEHPDWQRQTFLLQIAPPSRGEVYAYANIRAELDEVSGRINGAFAEADWVPIRYVNRGYARPQLTGFYRAADVGLITPLRDGMNLVAKEFVAAQDPDDPGVLILSRFAGAAVQLNSALIINPYSRDEISDALHCALLMPIEERRERHRAMLENVEEFDVSRWRKDFLHALGELSENRLLVETTPE